MTPQEALTAARDLAAEVGKKAAVYLSVNSDGGISGSLYTKGIVVERNDVSAFSVHTRATDFAEMLADLRQKWLETRDARGERLVEEMALEIIRLTAEFGQCTDASLRAKYDAELVATLSARAVERANEMAANGPFSVVTIAAANAA